MSRPTDYTEDVGLAICERIADGESLRTICSGDDMPGRTTVYQWLEAQPTFANHYARARIEQADTLADEIVTIADTATDAGLARLQIDARKWVAAKLKPLSYGDKVTTEHTGTIEVRAVEYKIVDPAP